MITNSSSKETSNSRANNKQEGDCKDDKRSNNNNDKYKPSSSSNPSSSSWLRLKDPRIVRVSRAFGGKDRHSKVCTVRGLRDRRVRLSVPTAIQLYDLQDRLGLSQPSKAVDWLLNAAKDEIDELPPLQMPPPSSLLPPHSKINNDNSSSQLVTTTKEVDWNVEANNNPSGFARSSFWNLDGNWRGKSKEVEVGNQSEKQNSQSNITTTAATATTTATTTSFMPYSSLFYQWDPNSSFSMMSHLGQMEEVHHNNVNMSMPSTLSLSSSSGAQVLVCPPGGMAQPYFPLEIDPRQVNHFQMLSSAGAPSSVLPNSSLYSLGQSVAVRPFQLSMSSPRPPTPVRSQNSDRNKEQDHHHFASK